MTDTFELVDKPELSISLFAVFLAAISLPVIIATFAYAPYEKKYAAGKPASFLLITIIISLMATNFIINHNRSHPTVEKYPTRFTKPDTPSPPTTFSITPALRVTLRELIWRTPSGLATPSQWRGTVVPARVFR